MWIAGVRLGDVLPVRALAAACNAAALRVAQTAPVTVLFSVDYCVFEAEVAARAGGADELCVLAALAFLRDEHFRVRLGTECTFVPCHALLAIGVSGDALEICVACWRRGQVTYGAHAGH